MHIETLGEVQTWPAFLNFAKAAILAAASTAASSRTSTGAWPPKFHGDSFDRVGALTDQNLADPGRPGEGHLPDARRRHQRRDHLLGRAEQQVDRAGERRRRRSIATSAATDAGAPCAGRTITLQPAASAMQILRAEG